jgi:hypothetical protein
MYLRVIKSSVSHSQTICDNSGYFLLRPVDVGFRVDIFFVKMSSSLLNHRDLVTGLEGMTLWAFINHKALTITLSWEEEGEM